MNILLVSPSQQEVYGNMKAPDYPHLGLAYLAAVLEKAGHLVRIADIDADSLTEDKFISVLKEKDYSLVGITTTTPTFKKALSLAGIVKRNSKAFTVLGGIHVTVTAQESVKEPSVDFVVKGEGERTILELVECLESGGDVHFVSGLYHKKDGCVLKNGERVLIENLDELPFPARHLFNKRNYNYPDALEEPAMPIITSRGCPAACSYCNSRSIFTRKFRVRSAPNVLAEIECLIGEFGVREIHIWDDNFITIKKRVFQIRDEIKAKKLNLRFAFPNGVRADYADLDVLKALKDMGTYSVAFGVESGNQNILDGINKNIKLHQIEAAFASAKRVGLETWAFFMLGLPGETDKTIRDTIDFAIRLKPDVAKFHILKPFPGSEVYNQFRNEGLIIEDDFDRFGIHTPPVHRLESLSPDEMLKWHKRAYREFYLRPEVIVRQILRLKSLNRVKLNVSAAFGVLRNMR